MTQQKEDPFDFILGQQACKEGKPCPEGASKMLERGYAAEYALSEIMSKQAEGKHGQEKTKRTA